MIYTTCEVCGNEEYCFLQFRPEVQDDENIIIIKRAACPHCLALVYDTNKNSKQIKVSSYYS